MTHNVISDIDNNLSLFPRNLYLRISVMACKVNETSDERDGRISFRIVAAFLMIAVRIVAITVPKRDPCSDRPDFTFYKWFEIYFNNLH